MDITLQPGKLAGIVTPPPSKSLAHRMLICSAFAEKALHLNCPDSNEDIDATADCLRGLGAHIQKTAHGYRIEPIRSLPTSADLFCKESGSTLRFLLPIVGILGVNATFHMEGRLPQRPLSPLWEEMQRMGCTLSSPTENTITCTGKLHPGTYYMNGEISSQFLSGLTFAFWIAGSEAYTLVIDGTVRSKPYYEMTKSVIHRFCHSLPDEITVESDWSNAAFWLTANILGSDLDVLHLEQDSTQGDRKILDILPQLQRGMSTICATDIPDLVPILSVAAAACHGAVFTDIARLRMKESDRVTSIIAMLENLGCKVDSTENTLTVHSTGLTGGCVNSFGDHRIAMSAAIAATICEKPVTILGAECVKKSYPKFWETYHRVCRNTSMPLEG